MKFSVKLGELCYCPDLVLAFDFFAACSGDSVHSLNSVDLIMLSITEEHRFFREFSRPSTVEAMCVCSSMRPSSKGLTRLFKSDAAGALTGAGLLIWCATCLSAGFDKIIVLRLLSKEAGVSGSKSEPSFTCKKWTDGLIREHFSCQKEENFHIFSNIKGIVGWPKDK